AGTTSTYRHSCERKLTELLSSVFLCSSELPAAAHSAAAFCLIRHLCFCRPLSKILCRVVATSWRVPCLANSLGSNTTRCLRVDFDQNPILFRNALTVRETRDERMQTINEPEVTRREIERIETEPRMGWSRSLKESKTLVVLVLVALAFVFRVHKLDATGLAEDEANKVFAVRAYDQGDFS